ncbi:MAG: hypothetical protein AAF431_04710 [Pseudomonadota bacterium]
MGKFPRWLILSLLIGAAVLCYIIGFTPGMGLFLILGMVFELSFWVKVFRHSDKE